MENQVLLNLYVMRFDQILNTMANQMLSVGKTNNITADFIRAMIPHHQAAINMCENLLSFTTYQPLIQLARNIISTQERGIQQMRHILRTTRLFENQPQEVDRYFKRYLSITKTMLFRMQTSARTSYINLDFIGQMIPHHEGAILMCKNLIQYKIDPRLRNVALTIIKEQSEGVRRLYEIKKAFTSSVSFI